MDSTVKAWWESYLHDFFGSSDLWFRRYLRDFSVDAWYGAYLKDFFSPCREIDDWYSQFRRDFLPSRFGRSSVGRVEVIGERHGEVLFRELVLVGRGRVTNDKCAKFRGHFGCIQHQKHVGGVVHARKYFNYCDRPSCPKCYRYGWASKEGNAVALRLAEASKKFGLPVEHIMLSLPRSDYDLTLKEAKRKAIEILYDRGVVGGVMIPHSQRIDRETRVEILQSAHAHSWLC